MKTNLPNRAVTFAVLDGHLVRTSTGSDGRAYTQRCSRAIYETVAHAVDETPMEGEGTTGQEIAKREGVPFTQANVAYEFMKERSVLVVRCKRGYPASITAFEDAMIEFLALGEELPTT